MELQTVLYEVKENIARITMNRPDKRNALNGQLLNDIDAAFSAAELDDSVRVVIFGGAGSSFSAGYDIKGSPYTSIPEGYEMWTTSNALRTIRKISERYQMIMYFPKPVIAKVQGYCVAAGCYLPGCCTMWQSPRKTQSFRTPATRGGGVTSMPLWITLLRRA